VFPGSGKTNDWKKLTKLAGWSPMNLPVKWHFSEYKFDMKYVFQENVLGMLLMYLSDFLCLRF